MNINVSSKNISIEKKEIIKTGNLESYEVNVTASEEYEKCACFVVIKYDDERFKIPVIDGKIKLPILLKVPEDKKIYIGFYGAYFENDEVKEINSANFDYLTVVEGSFKKGIPTQEEISTGILDRYLQAMKEFYRTSNQEFEDSVTEAESDITTAKNGAVNTINSEKDAAISAIGTAKDGAVQEIGDLNSGLKADVNTLKSDVNTIKGDIDEINATNETQSQNISTNTRTINENKNAFDTFKTTTNKAISELMVNKADLDKTGAKLGLDINNETFVMTFKLFDLDNNLLDSKQVDLPLETMVVDGEYNAARKEVTLVLQNGTEISFSVADLVSGLVSETTLENTLATLKASLESEIDKKVDKVNGKDLSTNDYSNEEKNANAANTRARHTHDNKSTLDKITEEYLQEREDKIDSLETKVASIENVLSNKGRLSLMFKNIIDRGEYIIRFPKWATSHNSAGEKLGANAGKVLEFATDTVKENNTYGLAFETIDVNATRKDDGTLVIDAIEGDKNFKRDGLVDVYVAIKKYYEKFWDDEEYVYYGRKFIPSDDYTIKDLCIDYNGEINEFFLIAKHIAGAQRDKEGILKLYSSAGLKPSRYNAVPTSETIAISHNGMIAAAKNKGKYYSGGLLSEYSHIKTTFWLKAGDRNNKGILNGNTSNGYQFKVAQAEEGVTRVIVTTTEANYIDLKSYVSVGNPGTATNFDRGNAYMHNILDDVKVIGKETIDDSHTALLLDCDPVDIPETARVSTMHERSGYCYDILGRNGSPVSCTNGKHGAVLDGIEYMVGGWELISNAVCDILGTDLSRQFLVCNDATKFDTNATNIRNNYYKSKIMTTTGTAAGWRYITEEKFDSAISSFLPTVTGESGSGNTVGYAGGVYVPANTSGLFEVLAFGGLYSNANAGISSLHVHSALGSAWWGIIARLSLNAVRGETAA